MLALFLDEDAASGTGPGAPLISDLAGAIANKYRTTDTRLGAAVKAITARHPYVRRFNRFCRQRGYRGGTQKFLIRVIRQFDNRESILRRALIDDLAHESRKEPKYIENYVKQLHDGGLLTVTRGNNFSSRIHVAG
jgi:hypothetical protein